MDPHREQWIEIGAAPLVVRALSGQVLFERDDAKFETPLAEIAAMSCACLGDVDLDTVRLVVLGEDRAYSPEGVLGDIVAPEHGEAVQLTLIRLSGPPIRVEATSGRPIELLNKLPPVNSLCHFDRNYRFLSMGGFGDRPDIQYIKTSNEDKATPCSNVMWRLVLLFPAIVYLNFRSLEHVEATGVRIWIDAQGWELSPEIASTVTSGVPNGPYEGPVYRKVVEPGALELFGSGCREGVYFVFIEISNG